MTTLAALACLKPRNTLVRANALVLFVVALAFGALDYVSNVSPHYRFGSAFGRDKPVKSASEVSGFNVAAGAHGNNVVVVIVESLGYLVDQAARDRIAAPLYDPAVTKDYLVTAGHTVYYGSTTSGEMRELCNTRTFYTDYVRGARIFLSAESAEIARLYQHRTARLLGRHVRAREMVSGSRLRQGTVRRGSREDHAPFCGGAFRGACDADLAPIITAQSQQAAKDGKPRFIYWHYAQHPHSGRAGRCADRFPVRARTAAVSARQRVCRMAELWHDVLSVGGEDRARSGCRPG